MYTSCSLGPVSWQQKPTPLSLSLRDCISGFGGFHISLVSEVNVLSTFKGGMGWLGWGGGRGRDEMT